jgi:LPXTG-motif cell wall-anchored protein
MGAGTARATDEKPQNVCSTWQLRGVTGTYGSEEDPVKFGDKPAGASFNVNTAELVKPTEGNMPGVEFATFDIDYEGAATTITADYSLSGGAKVDAGAIRMFYYESNGADTLNDAPKGVATADGDGVFKIEGVTKIGTLGFAYDASNDSTGKVVVKDVKIGNSKVKFKESGCKVEESPSPQPESPKPTTPPAVDPTTEGPGGGVDRPELPKTGVSGPQVAGIGGAVLFVGAILFVAARKRRTRYAA